jgi:glyoxylate reductase
MLTDPIDTQLLDAAPKLRVVSTLAAGFDNIDLAECESRGISVGNTPGVLTDATADLTMALLLALARRLPEAIAAVNDGEWLTWEPEFLLGMELRDRTLGIIGSGRIGSAVAERARAFGMNVIESGRQDGSNPGLPLDELLATSDIVSLHCPLTDATRGLVNSEFLAKMQPHALLINTARGQVLDQTALAEALRSGTIAGAALDVTDPEPLPPTDPLLTAPNLIVIPHLGSATHRTREAMADIAVDNLLAGLAGDPLPHRIA